MWLNEFGNSYLRKSYVWFADLDKSGSIERKVPRLVHPGEYVLDARNRPDDYDVKQILRGSQSDARISGSPSVLRHVDSVEAGSGSDHEDFEKFISGFEAGNRDQTVVRQHASQSVVRQHASQSVAVVSRCRQAVE